MGLNFQKAEKPDSAAAPAPSNTPTVGRERLRHFEENLARGRACVTAMEARCAQLSKIITDAVAADQALQLFISGDTGVSALAAHAAGETTPDEEVAKLIALQKCTAE